MRRKGVPIHELTLYLFYSFIFALLTLPSSSLVFLLKFHQSIFLFILLLLQVFKDRFVTFSRMNSKYYYRELLLLQMHYNIEISVTFFLLIYANDIIITATHSKGSNKIYSESTRWNKSNNLIFNTDKTTSTLFTLDPAEY